MFEAIDHIPFASADGFSNHIINNSANVYSSFTKLLYLSLYLSTSFLIYITPQDAAHAVIFYHECAHLLRHCHSSGGRDGTDPSRCFSEIGSFLIYKSNFPCRYRRDSSSSETMCDTRPGISSFSFSFSQSIIWCRFTEFQQSARSSQARDFSEQWVLPISGLEPA